MFEVGVFQTWGYLLEVPNNKVGTILGSMLGSPFSGGNYSLAMKGF